VFFKRIKALNERIESLKNRLAEAINQAEQRLSTFEERISNSENRLTEAINQTEQRLSTLEVRIGHSEDRLVTVENVLSDQNYLLRSLVLMAEAGGPIRNMPLPYPGSAPDVPFTIGYSCNLLNNHYTYCLGRSRVGTPP
jgi:uncharacterized coiled-coil protein SlyX